MPKFRNNRYFFSKLDLQLFAEGGGDDAGDDAAHEHIAHGDAGDGGVHHECDRGRGR